MAIIDEKYFGIEPWTYRNISEDLAQGEIVRENGEYCTSHVGGLTIDVEYHRGRLDLIVCGDYKRARSLMEGLGQRVKAYNSQYCDHMGLQGLTE
jgi:hypothetical protein